MMQFKVVGFILVLSILVIIVEDGNYLMHKRGVEIMEVT